MPLLAVVAVLAGFHSPSGNIRCVALPAPALLCSLAHADYAPKLQRFCLRPDGSGVDWHGFELGATRRGAVTCSGGALVTRPVHSVTLAYGRTWRRGTFTCTSRITGVTCMSRAGHGIFVSRQSWRVW